MRKGTEDNNNKKDKKFRFIYLLIKIRLIINKF